MLRLKTMRKYECTDVEARTFFPGGLGETQPENFEAFPEDSNRLN